MEYVIGVLVIIFIAFIVGILARKKHYKEIDRLAEKKIDIMNRPIAEELAKVKSLNMTGQTERMFERWRNEWDTIQTDRLADVETLLFDAEEYADKYRFNKSVQVQKKIEHIIEEIEITLSAILHELNELVGSEEQNKRLVEELLLAYREQKKRLLAHRHSFGEAASKLEEEFDQLALDFDIFNNQTESGDYLEAREQVLGIQAKLQTLKEKLDLIPDLIGHCQIHIPGLLHELKMGYTEMCDQGYPLSHLYFKNEIEKMEQDLEKYKEYIAETNTEEAAKGIDELNESIQSYYDLLEKEVVARQYVLSVKDSYQQKLDTSIDQLERLDEETELVKQIYQMPEKELEARSNLDKTLITLKSKWELLKEKIYEKETAYTALKEDIVELESKLDELKSLQKEFEEKLNTLRKDEMESRETIRKLHLSMTESLRIIKGSNLPGLPTSYELMVIQAKESIEEVKEKLEEKPLNMNAVMHHLDIASVAVSRVQEATVELTEQVMMAERVIQYGNRYRSKYPSVAVALTEAEKQFRNYQYQDALEHAAEAIEKVEPGSLKKIQEYLEHSNV